MGGRGRLRLSHYAVALALHGAALFAVSRIPQRAPAPANEPEIEIVTLEDAFDDVDVDERTFVPPWPPAAAPDLGAARGGKSARSALDAPAPDLRAREREPTTDTRREGSEEGPPVVTAAPEPKGMRELGIRGKNPFLPRSEAAVALAESKRAVDRALTDPARERDRKLGLGPEGPVLTALGEATSRSTAPVRGRAVFVASADANGVFAIELRDSEGGRGGWDDARRLALEALKGKKLRLPPAATRAVMRLEVTSAWKLRGGQDPGTNLSVLRIPVTKGETKDSTNVSVLDPIPKLVDLSVTLPDGSKIPLVGLQFDLFATKNADPANFGAKPRRIVHARVVESEIM